MEFNALGRTGLVVSRLSVGAMTFGSNGGALQRLGQAEARYLVDAALEMGVNHVNTAATYSGGQSEEFVGRALGDRRDDVIISTKVAGPTGSAVVHRGLSRRHVLEAVEGSLRRLGTDYIDVYLAHRPDPITPLEETLEAFDSVVRQGKVRYLGFSNWPGWMAAKALGLQEANGWQRFIASESYYSLLGREVEHEIVPFCEDAGVGMMVWSPLAMGFLSGRYTRDDPTGEGGRLANFATGSPIDPDRAHDVLDEVRAIARAHGATPAQVSLAWLLTKNVVDTILVGASSLDQLQQNMAAVDVELGPDDLNHLNLLTAPPLSYPGWVNKKVDEIPGYVTEVRAKQ